MSFLRIFTTFGVVLFSVNILISQNKIVDKIIAKVGGEIVLYSDWQEQINYLTSKKANLNESDKCSILENILIQKFLVHQAKLDSIELKDEEIEHQLNARMDQILQYMNDDYKKFEEYYGQSVAEVRNRFKEDLKNQLLAERIQNKIVGNITVTPQETEEFFKKLPKDSIPYFNAEVEISEIVYRPKINPEQKKLAVEKLEKALKRIKGGEDFAKVATILSDDPGSAKNGGDLGWMKRGSLVPEFEAVAYALESDSISGIVETEFGLHIIQLLGRRGNSIHTRHILVKPRYVEDDYELAKHYLDSIRGKILKDTIPFEKAARMYSDKKSESYNNGGLVLNPKTGNALFETGDLEPDIFFSIDNLKIGEISQPVSSSLEDGTKYFRIIKLNAKTEPHKANLKQDYSKIQMAAKDLKKNVKFNDWLSQKLPNAYLKLEKEITEICPGIGEWGRSQ